MRDDVEMSATHGRWDFQGGTREQTRVENGTEVQGVQESRPQVEAVGGIGKIVVGASAVYVKKQKDFSVDDEKLLELEILQPKENISDVCLGVELSIKQQNEIMWTLSKFQNIFTDIPTKTSIIEHRVHLVDDRSIRCRP